MDCLALEKEGKTMWSTAHTHAVAHPSTWFGIHLLSSAPQGAHFQRSCCFLLEIIPVIETSSVLPRSESSLSLLITAWVLNVSVLSVGRPSVSRWFVDSGWGQRYCPTSGSSSTLESCSGVAGRWSDGQVVWNGVCGNARSAIDIPVCLCSNHMIGTLWILSGDRKDMVADTKRFLRRVGWA